LFTGKKGTAISFFTPENFHLVYDLLSVMHESHQEIPAELKQVLANQKAIDSAKRNAEKTQAQHRLFKSTSLSHTKHTFRFLK
jgi:superfamily II DNA/RNA helicase